MTTGWGPAPGVAYGPAIVVIGTLSADAEAAIDASGARILATVDWDALDATTPCAGLILAGIPGDIGHGALERLAEVIGDGGGHALVAVEAEALDAAWSILGDGSVEFLCDAEAGEWSVALALAAHREAPSPAGVREGGDPAERLRRLHAEVARIAAQLAGLASSERAAVDERRRGYGAPPAEVAIDVAEVRATIRARRMRGQFFDARRVEDPGWDMLLDLFAAELEGARVSVSSLCIAAGVPPTTALRWISRMADAGLMVRVADPGDRRRAFVALSVEASAAIRSYAATLRRAGLPLV